jgi:hypothetical protein
MTRKRHWVKFNFKEWRSDPELQQCSRAARSLWLDLCGLIYEAEDGGRLTLRGKPLDGRQLSAVLGDDPRTIAAILKELGKAGVYSVDPDGAIFCRRIRREMLKENIRDFDPEVTPEVPKRRKRFSKKNKAVQNHNATQIPEPEIEPLQGSILVSHLTNVVELRPRAGRRGASPPLATTNAQRSALTESRLEALQRELEDLDRFEAKYPEARSPDRRSRLVSAIEEAADIAARENSI